MHLHKVPLTTPPRIRLWARILLALVDSVLIYYIQRHQTTANGQRTLEIGHQTSHIRHQRDAGHQTAEFRHHRSDIRHRTSGHKTPNIIHHTSDIEHAHQTSDMRHRVSDISHQKSGISYIRNRTSDIRY